MAETIKFLVVQSRQDLHLLLEQRNINRNIVGAMLAVEGIYTRNVLNANGGVREQKVEQLFASLYNSGYRMMALSHFVDGEFGGSNTGMGALSSKAPYGPYLGPQDVTGSTWDKKPIREKLGVSEAGVRMIQLMMQHGVLLDLAHASDGLISASVEMAAEAHKPIVVSHTGFQDLDHDSRSDPDPRNLTPEQVKAIAATGGVIGVGFDKDFVGGDRPIDVARAIQYVANVINEDKIHLFNDPDLARVAGYEIVALGSDFDGGIRAPVDVAHLAAITRALTCTYYWYWPWNWNCLVTPLTQTQLEDVMGRNFQRVMEKVLPDVSYKYHP